MDGIPNRLGLKPDYTTIHPDKLEWKNWYNKYDVEVRYDEGCILLLGGYCNTGVLKS